jgi:16S rRNA (guanine527-N7)-methyltransferase
MKRDSDRDGALKLAPVSRETERRLALFVGLLAKWRHVTNLISPASYDQVWLRHIADSAQLIDLAPEAKRWVDLGSGAGFPGMVLAIQLADTPGALVHLVESDQRKCAFLREVARETGAAAEIHPARIEAIAPQSLMPVDAITARALAALPVLIGYAKPWIEWGAVGIFPRGRTAEAQAVEFAHPETLQFKTINSRIDPKAAILIVRHGESAQHSTRS